MENDYLSHTHTPRMGNVFRSLTHSLWASWCLFVHLFCSQSLAIESSAAAAPLPVGPQINNGGQAGRTKESKSYFALALGLCGRPQSLLFVRPGEEARKHSAKRDKL